MSPGPVPRLMRLMRLMQHRRLSWLSRPWTLWLLRAGLLAALSMGWLMAVAPSTAQGDWFPQADKLRHAVAFAVFMLWACAARLRPQWMWALLLLAYGVGIEWAQSMVPSRQASWGDALADAVGVVVGWGLGRWMAQRSLWLTRTWPTRT